MSCGLGAQGQAMYRDDRPYGEAVFPNQGWIFWCQGPCDGDHVIQHSSTTFIPLPSKKCTLCTIFLPLKNEGCQWTAYTQFSWPANTDSRVTAYVVSASTMEQRKWKHSFFEVSFMRSQNIFWWFHSFSDKISASWKHHVRAAAQGYVLSGALPCSWTLQPTGQSYFLHWQWY